MNVCFNDDDDDKMVIIIIPLTWKIYSTLPAYAFIIVLVIYTLGLRIGCVIFFVPHTKTLTI